MHSILKDGSYIQYGPKIIPNPNAEGGGGGGGEGDYSLAKVTLIINNVTPDLYGYSSSFKFPQEGYDAYYNLTLLNPVSSNEFNIILYQNESMIIPQDLYCVVGNDFYIWDESEPTIEGAAEYDDGNIIVHGDCTITLDVIPE